MVTAPTQINLKRGSDSDSSFSQLDLPYHATLASVNGTIIGKRIALGGLVIHDLVHVAHEKQGQSIDREAHSAPTFNGLLVYVTLQHLREFTRAC